jgi:hypothetical protein
LNWSLSPRVRTTVALAGVVVCTAVAVFAPGPDPWLRSAGQLHDYLHVPGFAFVAALLVAAFPARAGLRGRGLALHYAVLLLSSVGVGILVEVLQGLTGGDMDAGDVVRDLAGASATMLVVGSWWPDARRWTRWALRSGALVLAIGFTAPTAGALADEARARREFPVLADFSHADELQRFEWSEWTTASLVQADEGDTGRRPALGVSLSPGLFPGFTLKYFPRDWRGYRSFVLSYANPSSTSYEVNVRIDDMRHNNEHTDRFNGTYQIAPGRHEIRIPLADVESAPRGRRLDLANVRTVVVFAYKLDTTREIVVESVRLKR